MSLPDCAIVLEQGRITEIVGEKPSSGSGLIIATLIERLAEQGGWMALVDGKDAFDPWSVPPVSLERLLWVRCRDVNQAIRATDLLLRDGNIGTVLLDLQMHHARDVFRVPSSAWHRLRMLAGKSGAALCAFTPCKVVPCAGARIVLQHRFDLADLERSPPLLLQSLMATAQRWSHTMAEAHLAAAN